MLIIKSYLLGWCTHPAHSQRWSGRSMLNSISGTRSACQATLKSSRWCSEWRRHSMQMLVRQALRRELKKQRADCTKLELLVVLELLILDQQTTRKKLQSMAQTVKRRFLTILYRAQSTCGLKMVVNRLNKRAKVQESKARNTMMINISSIIQTYQILSMLTTALRSLPAVKTIGKSFELWMLM